MNAPNITGKTRASRIPLDYYKKPDRVFRRKLVLTAVASIAAIVWLVTLLPAGKSTPLGNNRFSHGPICTHHQPFGHDCAQCHVDFPMIAGKDGEGRFKGDNKCMTCHLGNGGDVHHGTQLVSMTPNCGVCHKDHKGPNFDMKRVADQQCAICHKDLEKSMKPGVTCTYEKEVTSFSDKHPEFRSAKVDPGKLKFNHLYHMTDGIVLTQGGKPFTVGDMKDGKQKSDMLRRGLKPTDAVRMECADCHSPERTQPPIRPSVDDLTSESGKKTTFDYFLGKQTTRGWFDQKEEGRPILKPPHRNEAYMAPVKFDAHCASCHPVSFGKDMVVTHGLQPDDERFRKELETLVATWDVKSPTISLGLPGKTPAKTTLGEKEKYDLARRALLEGQRACGECHVAEDGSNLTVDSKKVAIPNVPGEWFRHARFDHAKHAEKEINCRECHAEAYPANNDFKGVLAAYMMPRKGAEQVMVPGIDNCRQCHSPKPTPDAVKRNVTAKHDCTECHGYHHGTPPKK